MNEFDLIRRLTLTVPGNDQVIVGPGDDCAVVQTPDRGQWLLFKTDAIVEGIHFTKEAAPEQIGHKALGRCLSDFAAMAGTPLHAVVTLALPPDFEPVRIERIYDGMGALARRFGVAIVGGETVRNPERMILSVAVIGEVAKERCILRSGSQAGDAIFVTGTLGGSLAGRHLEFEPRLVEAKWLAERFPVHAMLDLSDGLAGDIRHLLNASNVGAELLASAIPISRSARDLSKLPGTQKSPLVAAITDGEDFELLFTLPSTNAVTVLDQWKSVFPETRLSCIGRITEAPGLRLRTKDGIRPLSDHGYVHFT